MAEQRAVLHQAVFLKQVLASHDIVAGIKHTIG
jgi:hypothetical protein